MRIKILLIFLLFVTMNLQTTDLIGQWGYIPTWNKPVIGLCGPSGNALTAGHINQYVLPGVKFLDAVQQSQARIVRVNFQKCPDGTFNCYMGAINHMLSKNQQIYGLIDPYEVVNNFNPWSNYKINEYAVKFRQIVQTYSGKVKVFESVNEPNIAPNVINATQFGKILRAVWKEVRKFSGLNSIKIITGPVMTDNKDVSLQSCINYLKTAINHIPSNEELPFNGIGFHFYPYKSCSGINPWGVQTEVYNVINNFWSQMAAHRGALSWNRKIWISEFGFNNEIVKGAKPSGWTADYMQAWYLAKSMEALKWHSGKIDAAMIFNLSSFCANEGGCSGSRQDWGLIMPEYVHRNGNCFENLPYNEKKMRKKKSFCVFQQMVWGSNGQTALNNCSWAMPSANEDVVEEMKNEIEIKVYPNPVRDFVNVEILNQMDRFEEAFKISIFDLNGRLIFTQDYLNETSIGIPMGQLDEGIYFVNVQGPDGLIENHKIVKM